jgi:hypothetical protein
MALLNLITISLSPPYPDNGLAATVVRLTGQDKMKFDLAAHHMGMNKALLMRTLLVKGADKILAELGVKIDYEQQGDTYIE